MAIIFFHTYNMILEYKSCINFERDKILKDFRFKQDPNPGPDLKTGTGIRIRI